MPDLTTLLAQLQAEAFAALAAAQAAEQRVASWSEPSTEEAP